MQCLISSIFTVASLLINIMHYFSWEHTILGAGQSGPVSRQVLHGCLLVRGPEQVYGLEDGFLDHLHKASFE